MLLVHPLVEHVCIDGIYCKAKKYKKNQILGEQHFWIFFISFDTTFILEIIQLLYYISKIKLY